MKYELGPALKALNRQNARKRWKRRAHRALCLLGRAAMAIAIVLVFAFILSNVHH